MASTLKVNTIQHTGGTTGITVGSDGKITILYNSSGFVPEFVAWSVKKNIKPKYCNGAQTQVQWNSETFDTHNAFGYTIYCSLWTRWIL